MRYFLKIAYDGTNFHGWQRQPNASSVQQTIEEALSTILRHRVEITGAGRTDTGVHAKVMYAHFDSDRLTDKTAFLSSLNKLVGNEISISDIQEVTDNAHARFDALSRTYKYYVTLAKNPFLYNYACRMHRKPDIGLMNEAAAILMETDDFSSFAKLHADAKTNICDVSVAHWEEDSEKECLVFTITANRFLRNMVRAVVGTLIEVGTGKITIDEFKKIIERKDRCAAGISMPAKGLFLTEIVYPIEIFV